MISGWYYNKNKGQRLLSLEEIAGACGCGNHKVKDWFAGKMVRPASSGEIFIDAGDVIAFLVRNNMPVSPALLPPKTRKILFIATDDTSLEKKVDSVDAVLSYFTARGNVLVENATAGKFADLTILTFSPDVVVLFLDVFDQAGKNTLNLLSSFPELKTILFIEETLRNTVRDQQIFDEVDLIIGPTPSVPEMDDLMRSVFEG